MSLKRSDTSDSLDDKSPSLGAQVAKAFTKKATWSDKDELLDVIYWGRQFISILIGVTWGIIPLKGVIALLLYVAISTVVAHYYLVWFQAQDDELFGGFWEIAKEGFGAAFASFMVAWISTYSFTHFD